MKKYHQLLVALPITFLFIFHTYNLNSAKGLYSEAGLSDPSFLYLNSALHIARGDFPIHVDNPGATTQLVGALSFRLTYLISGKNEFTKDVLTRPEHYLGVYNAILVSVVAFVIGLVGYLVFGVSKSYALTFLIQLAPFFSTFNFYGLLRISPESFLMALGMFWLYLLTQILYEKDANRFSKKYYVAFGVLAGVGVATKLNFLPLCFFPLFVLNNTKHKLFYVIIAMLTFVGVAFLPLFASDKLFIWARDLFFQSGIYASGNRTIIDTQTFVPNIVKIIQIEQVFSVTFIAILLTFGIAILKKNKLLTRVLLGIIVVLLLHTAMVAKHYNQHYLLPMMFVAVGGIVVMVFMIQKYLNVAVSYLFTLSVLFCLAVANVPTLLKSYLKTNHYEQVQAFINKYPKQTLKITYYEASSVSYALSFGTYCFFGDDHRTVFDNILSERYPNHVFFHNQKYYDWGREVNIDTLLSKKDKFILQGTKPTPKMAFKGFQVKDSAIIAKEVIYLFEKQH